MKFYLLHAAPRILQLGRRNNTEENNTQGKLYLTHCLKCMTSRPRLPPHSIYCTPLQLPGLTERGNTALAEDTSVFVFSLSLSHRYYPEWYFYLLQTVSGKKQGQISKPLLFGLTTTTQDKILKRI